MQFTAVATALLAHANRSSKARTRGLSEGLPAGGVIASIGEINGATVCVRRATTSACGV
ncbi:Hypothetical protein BN69_2687 [Methylocystis sp. SC2]|nr:Hypothetical protein BN69_2687 [Methylocystis sp. SC2]